MSVIVKGMEMPTECRKCPFNEFGTMSGETWCWVNNVTLAKKFETINFDGRPDWCPLVALPDHHGRLVDADALGKAVAGMVPYAIDDASSSAYTDGIGAAYYLIGDAPTIVEAEDTEC